MESSKPRTTFSHLATWAAPYKSSFIASVLVAVVGVFCSVAPYYCLGKIVILLLNNETNFSLYLNWLLLSSAFWIGNAILMSISTTLSHRATFRVIADVRAAMCEKLARISLGRVIARPSGETKNIIVERVDSIEPTLAHLLPEMTSNMLIPIVTLIYLFTIDWRLALWSMLTLPLGLLAMMGVMSGFEGRFARYVKANKSLNSIAVEYINGIEVIKTFGQSAKSYKKFSDAAFESAYSAIDWMRSTQRFFSLAMVLLPATFISVLPAAVVYTVSGTLPLSDLVMVLVLSIGLMAPLIAMASFSDDLGKVRTIVDEITSILGEEELHRPEKAVIIDDWTIQGQGVHFAYGATEILHGVDFTFKQGEVSALVGPSGSGKSTIARLIASMWDVTDGRITIGGVDIRDIPLEQLNHAVAYVSQDNFLFNETVRENIRKGNLAASDAQVETIAKASGCHEFIMSLENGYETLVGTSGGHLSGGERQRIAIARAMLKGAPIVILDEATAYTDPENEAIIQEAVAKLVEGKTLIVVAHRLSTITDSDQILVVKDGNIVDTGRHETLLENCPLYNALWQAHIGAKDSMEA